MLWRERGSGVLATRATTHGNGVSDLWFGEGRASLAMSGLAHVP